MQHECVRTLHKQFSIRLVRDRCHKLRVWHALYSPLFAAVINCSRVLTAKKRHSLLFVLCLHHCEPSSNRFCSAYYCHYISLFMWQLKYIPLHTFCSVLHFVSVCMSSLLHMKCCYSQMKCAWRQKKNRQNNSPKWHWSDHFICLRLENSNSLSPNCSHRNLSRLFTIIIFVNRTTCN